METEEDTRFVGTVGAVVSDTTIGRVVTESAADCTEVFAFVEASTADTVYEYVVDAARPVSVYVVTVVVAIFVAFL